MRTPSYTPVWIMRRADRPSRPHQVQWRDPATGRRRTRSFPRLADARAAARRIERAINEGLLGRDDTWDTAIHEFAEHLLAGRCGRAQRYNYERAIDTLGRVLHPRRLDDLTPARLTTYFADFAAGRCGRVPTIYEHRKDFSCVRAFFNWCVASGRMGRSPLDGLTAPRLPDTLTAVPPDSDWVRLLRRIPARQCDLADPQAWHLYVLLAVTTGVDRDNLLAVRLGPFAGGGNRLRLLTAADGLFGGAGGGVLRIVRPKTGRANLIGIPPEVCQRIARRIEQLGPQAEWLLPWRNFPRKQWDRLRRCAGFHYTFKSLRAAAVTRSVESAVLHHGADLAGHSSTRTTRRHYVDWHRIALALARAAPLPPLPPLPPLALPRDRAATHRARSAARAAAAETPR